MSNKYSQSKIYGLYHNDEKLLYIGSTTTTLKLRLQHHISHSKQDKHKTRAIYQFMNNNENISIKLIEEYFCDNKFDLEKREGELIRDNDFNKLLNSEIPHRTQSEYRKDNPEKHKEYDKKSYEKKKTNPEFNEKKKEQSKKSYQKCKENIHKYEECDCSLYLKHSEMGRHIKTKKHLKYLKNEVKGIKCECGEILSTQKIYNIHLETEKHKLIIELLKLNKINKNQKKDLKVNQEVK